MSELTDLEREISDDLQKGNLLLAIMKFSALLDFKIFMATENSQSVISLKLLQKVLKTIIKFLKQEEEGNISDVTVTESLRIFSEALTEVKKANQRL